MADWSNLPHDLLTLIAKRVHSCEDFISYGEVCTSWRSAATKKNYTNKFPQIPWLILTQQHHHHHHQEKEKEISLTFISLKKGILHNKVITLPLFTRKSALLSSQGWLLFRENICNMYIVHPLSRAKIRLPSARTIPYCYYYAGYEFGHITKFCLSDSPSVTSDYLVMLSFGCLDIVAFCRPGDIKFTTTKYLGAQIYDIAYYEKKLYCVDAAGRVFVCEIDGPNPTELSFVMNLKDVVREFERLYILELGGKIVVVSRSGEVDNVKGFRVFEMNLVKRAWFEMKDIGDMTIFLGSNSSFSVDACYGNGCKANCIYFTYDFFDMLKISSGNCWNQNGVHVYNLLDGSIKGECFGRTASATWIEPSF